jgi:hypothetical protein
VRRKRLKGPAKGTLKILGKTLPPRKTLNTPIELSVQCLFSCLLAHVFQPLHGSTCSLYSAQEHNVFEFD